MHIECLHRPRLVRVALAVEASECQSSPWQCAWLLDLTHYYPLILTHTHSYGLLLDVLNESGALDAAASLASASFFSFIGVSGFCGRRPSEISHDCMGYRTVPWPSPLLPQQPWRRHQPGQTAQHYCLHHRYCISRYCQREGGTVCTWLFTTPHTTAQKQLRGFQAVCPASHLRV